MGFALSQLLIHLSIGCAEGSIPFTRSNSSKVLGTSSSSETNPKQKKSKDSVEFLRSRHIIAMNLKNSVKLYRPSERDPYFKIKFKANGKWVTRKRKTETAARELVEQIHQAIHQGESRLATLTSAEKERLNAALALLPEGKNLLQLVLESTEAMKILPAGHSLGDAVKFYSQFNSTTAPLRFADLVDQFSKTKDADWSRPHARAQKNRLNRLKEAFNCKVSELTPEHIEVFLAQFEQAKPKTRNHFKALIKQLLCFAVELDALPAIKPFNIVLKLEKAKVSIPEIISPEQFEQYLKNAPIELIPALALGGFAGLRPEEIKKITWEDYLKSEDKIPMSADITKTSLVRFVPKKAALRYWLGKVPNRTGKMLTISTTQKNKLVKNLKKLFGGPIGKASQGRDLFRHCYVSYRFGECQRTSVVADETGHSESVLKSSYLKLVSEEEATKWFSLHEKS